MPQVRSSRKKMIKNVALSKAQVADASPEPAPCDEDMLPCDYACAWTGLHGSLCPCEHCRKIKQGCESAPSEPSNEQVLGNSEQVLGNSEQVLGSEQVIGSEQVLGSEQVAVQVQVVPEDPPVRQERRRRILNPPLAQKPAGKPETAPGQQPCREVGSGNGLRSGPSDRSDESTRAS